MVDEWKCGIFVFIAVQSVLLAAGLNVDRGLFISPMHTHQFVFLESANLRKTKDSLLLLGHIPKIGHELYTVYAGQRPYSYTYASGRTTLHVSKRGSGAHVHSRQNPEI